MPSTKDFKILKVEKLPHSEAEITGEIALPFLVAQKGEAVRSLNKSLKLPGFREGKIPEDILIKNMGEMALWEEVAEVAIAKLYTEIVSEAKVSAIGRPEVSITKLVPNSSLEFKIKVAVEPEFKLPNYKALAKEVNKEKLETEVTEKEVEDLIKELESRNIKPQLKEGESLEELIKTDLKRDKEMRNKEKVRIKIIDSLVKETAMEVPEILVRSELEKMFAQFKDDVARAGIKWVDYLKELKKTEEGVKKEWQPRALERVKAELILAKIANEEKLEPEVKELEHESKHLLEHYPDADPLRVRMYIYTQLRTQKVFEFLESLA